MNLELFESFYRGNVDKIATEIVMKNMNSNGKPIFQYMPNLPGVYEEYLNQKTLLKTVIKREMSDQSNDTDSDLLDGHKIAALITCAIIKVRLITRCEIDDSEDHPYSLGRASRMNEQLACLSGLSCLLAFMADNEENLFSDPNDHKKTTLLFPKTNYEDRSSYLDSLVRALYYSNTFSNINPLLLSHIYFQIEAHHRLAVEFKQYKATH